MIFVEVLVVILQDKDLTGMFIGSQKPKMRLSF